MARDDDIFHLEAFMASVFLRKSKNNYTTRVQLCKLSLNKITQIDEENCKASKTRNRFLFKMQIFNVNEL